MIPETLGHRVWFRFGDGTVIRPIIAWNADGKPLVVSPDGVLIEAEVIAGNADYYVDQEPAQPAHCASCCDPYSDARYTP